MSDAHENFLAKLFKGRKSKGSGNQFNDQMDGRNERYETPFALAWDGKSTLTKSTSISRTMWEKAVAQANGEIPMLALRFYDTYRLAVGLDLVVLEAEEFYRILEAARLYEEHRRFPVLHLNTDVTLTEEELAEFTERMNKAISSWTGPVVERFGLHGEIESELPPSDHGDSPEEHPHPGDPSSVV